jgi:hypothetical protein
MDKEEKDMSLVLNNKSTKKSLSRHPKSKSKVPRLDVVKGVAQVNSNDPLQRKWFEEFKRQ